MNESLLCAAIFEQAILDYERARKFLCNPHGKNKKELDRDIASANRHIQDVRQFATSKEAMLYSCGSEKVIRAFSTRLDEIDKKYKFYRFRNNEGR